MGGTEPAHLVMGGGGVRTLAFAGALESLERRYRWASISACSMGTLIALLRATGMSPARMQERLRSFDYHTVPALRPARIVAGAPRALLRGRTLLAASPMGDVFRALAGEEAARTPLDGLEIPVAAAALDTVSRRIVAYSSAMHGDLTAGRLLDIAMALPPVFPLVRIGRQALADATYGWSVPIFLAEAFQPGLPVVVLRAPRLPRERRLLGPGAAELRIVGQHSVDRFLAGPDPRTTFFDIASPHGPAARLPAAKRQELFELGRATVATPLDRHEATVEAGYADTLARRDAAKRQSSGPPSTVFVSYAHVDDETRQRLRFALRHVIDLPHVEVWDDGYLEPGERWAADIAAAIDRSAAAVLLVSEGFTASRFINDVELPRLLARADASALRLLWVGADGCPPPPTLAARQSVGSPAAPASTADLEERFDQVARILLQLLDGRRRPDAAAARPPAEP